MVVPPRLELELTVSKTAVLPLHHGTVAGGFLVSAPHFGEFFFKKIPYQSAKSNPARAGLQLVVAQPNHDPLVDQATVQRHVGAVGRKAGDFAALAKRQTP